MIYGFDDDKNKIPIAKKIVVDMDAVPSTNISIIPLSVGDTSLEDWYVVAMFYQVNSGSSQAMYNYNPQWSKESDGSKITVDGSVGSGKYLNIILQKIEWGKQ